MGGMGKRPSLASVPSGSWSYNRDDELSRETYDQDGNVTAANGKSFSYDSQNQLLSMNGGAVQMLYDGDGNRVAKSVTSGGVTTTTQYLVDDLNPTGLPQIMDELTNGVVTRTYTYGLQRISEDQQINGAWTPSYYSYDGMGSVRQLTNTSGTVTDTYDYDAFGNEITHTGTTPNNYLYRGEQFDSDLGLYYLRARYYNPATGRFMSRDPNSPQPTDASGRPIDPRELHKYLYAGGDPIDLLDPTGRITYTKPSNNIFGNAAAEYVGVISNVSFRIGFYVNFALPAFLATRQGKLVIVTALGVLATGEVIACDLQNLAEILNPDQQVNCNYFDTPDVQ
jgi:RHS repeat-associated protein